MWSLKFILRTKESTKGTLVTIAFNFPFPKTVPLPIQILSILKIHSNPLSAMMDFQITDTTSISFSSEPQCSLPLLFIY